MLEKRKKTREENKKKNDVVNDVVNDESGLYESSGLKEVFEKKETEDDIDDFWNS